MNRGFARVKVARETVGWFEICGLNVVLYCHDLVISEYRKNSQTSH